MLTGPTAHKAILSPPATKDPRDTTCAACGHRIDDHARATQGRRHLPCEAPNCECASFRSASFANPAFAEFGKGSSR